jgi:hypothetical protein
MFSTIDRSVVYDVDTDITEHDINIVSDLWTMAGQQVYRGARDPRYTHANVYWLYDPVSLDRVGVSEHALANPADVSLLWYKDNVFGTLLQEDGWTAGDTLWKEMPTHAYEQCMTEGWTTPTQLIERCLRGPMRIVTVDVLIERPTVYNCVTCGRVSMSAFPCGVAAPLSIPEKEKVFFIDERMVVHTPPKGGSLVWSLLGFTEPPVPSAASSDPVEEPPEPVQVEELETAA